MKKLYSLLGAILFALMVSVAIISSGFSQGVLSTTLAHPNIVVIMADDLCTGMLDIALKRGFMPNLQRSIIRRGLTFANSFVTNSLCCPSRSTFLTGQYSHNHQVLNNSLPTGGVTRLDDRETLPVWLQRQGYWTGMVGKYLNGYGQNNQSFSDKDDPTYIPPGWNDWQGLVGSKAYQMYNYTVNDNGTLVNYGKDLSTPPEEYQTRVLAQRATDFIREAATRRPKQPFFLWLTPLAPHAEHDRPVSSNCPDINTIRPEPKYVGTAKIVQLPKTAAFNEEDISDKPTWFQAGHPKLNPTVRQCLTQTYRDRIESLRSVDDLIGQVVQELKSVNRFANTHLIFTSDNGFLFGEHRAGSKRFAYESSIRVPLYWHQPRQMQAKTIQPLVLNNDLAPTIANLTGAKPTHPVDGRSLERLFNTPDLSPWRQQFLVENYVLSELISPFSAIRSSDSLLYSEYTEGGQEFYDMKTDPEQLNSIREVTSRQVELQHLLDQLKTCKGEACKAIENLTPAQAHQRFKNRPPRKKVSAANGPKPIFVPSKLDEED